MGCPPRGARLAGVRTSPPVGRRDPLSGGLTAGRKPGRGRPSRAASRSDLRTRGRRSGRYERQWRWAAPRERRRLPASPGRAVWPYPHGYARRPLGLLAGEYSGRCPSRPSAALQIRALIRPVWKHGPRSLACARVTGWKTQRRNESVWGRPAPPVGGWEFRPPRPEPRTPGASRSRPEWRRTRSAHAVTRKMVNYAWPGRSQGKPWWRSEAILTCKSIV